MIPLLLLQVLRSQLLANRLLPEVSHAVVAAQNAHAREGREEASIDLRQMERHFLSLVEVLAGQQPSGFGPAASTACWHLWQISRLMQSHALPEEYYDICLRQPAGQHAAEEQGTPSASCRFLLVSRL